MSLFKRTIDRAIRIADEGEERWITVRGSHIKIDGEGNPVAGNPKLIAAMKGKKSGGASKAEATKTGTKVKQDKPKTTKFKNYNDFSNNTEASSVLQEVNDLTYGNEEVDKKKAERIGKSLNSVLNKYVSTNKEHTKKFVEELSDTLEDNTGEDFWDIALRNKTPEITKALKTINTKLYGMKWTE